MRLTKSLAAALTASLVLLAASPAALASPHETTADLAEQSRMLAPRATKAYLMVQQGIDPEAGRRLLADSVSRLDQNLAALRSAGLDERCQRLLDAAFRRRLVQREQPLELDHAQRLVGGEQRRLDDAGDQGLVHGGAAVIH